MAKILKTVLMFSLLIGYGSVISIFSPIVPDFLMIMCVILLMLINRAYKMDRKLFKILIGIYCITSLSALLTFSSFMDYSGIYMRSTIVALLITAFKNDYVDITRYFIRSLWILVFLALINFILTMAIPSLFIETYSSTGFRVHSIGLIFNYLAVSDIFGIQFVRNQSIFWEPGILQIPVNILIYYLLIEKKASLKKASLPIFILLTTGSTAGYMILMFILLAKFRKSFALKGKGVMRTVGMIFIITAFIPILAAEVNRKFISEEGQFSSTARLYDIYMGLNVIYNHPLTGVGMNQENYLNAILGKSVDINGEQYDDARGNTNTILSMFIKLGAPLAIALIYFLYKQNLFHYRFIFFVVMFCSLMSEPLLVVYLLILLIMSSVKVTPSKVSLRSDILYKDTLSFREN